MHRTVDNSYRFSFLSSVFFGGGVTFSFCSTHALHIELRHVILLIQALNNMGVGGLAGSPPPGITHPHPPLRCASIHLYMYLGSMWKYYTVNIKKEVLCGTLPPLPTPEYLENLRFFFFFLPIKILNMSAPPPLSDLCDATSCYTNITVINNPNQVLKK